MRRLGVQLRTVFGDTFLNIEYRAVLQVQSSFAESAKLNKMKARSAIKLDFSLELPNLLS